MQEHLGSFGLLFVSVAIVLFAFTSIIGNHFYAEANFKFISTSKRGLFVFRLLAMLMVFEVIYVSSGHNYPLHEG